MTYDQITDEMRKFLSENPKAFYEVECHPRPEIPESQIQDKILEAQKARYHGTKQLVWLLIAMGAKHPQSQDILEMLFAMMDQQGGPEIYLSCMKVGQIGVRAGWEVRMARENPFDKNSPRTREVRFDTELESEPNHFRGSWFYQAVVDRLLSKGWTFGRIQARNKHSRSGRLHLNYEVPIMIDGIKVVWIHSGNGFSNVHTTDWVMSEGDLAIVPARMPRRRDPLFVRAGGKVRGYLGWLNQAHPHNYYFTEDEEAR